MYKAVTQQHLISDYFSWLTLHISMNTSFMWLPDTLFYFSCHYILNFNKISWHLLCISMDTISGTILGTILCTIFAAPCEPGYFACMNRLCIHKSKLCDYVDDCGDRSDETSEHAQCDTSKCSVFIVVFYCCLPTHEHWWSTACIRNNTFSAAVKKSKKGLWKQLFWAFEQF